MGILLFQSVVLIMNFYVKKIVAWPCRFSLYGVSIRPYPEPVETKHRGVNDMTKPTEVKKPEAQVEAAKPTTVAPAKPAPSF